MAREVARDLAQSGLFRDVQLVTDPSAAREYDLVLSGTLKSTEFDIYASSYMLGFVGVILWMIPIPVGRDAATVAIDFQLSDRAGEPIWSYSMSERAGKLFTLYNSSGESTSSQFRIEIKRYGSNKLGIDGDSFWAYHAEALREGMGEMKSSLADSLSESGP
jgi:hypothetical protein